MFYRIVRAVQYLHAKGVCHRDLSLENTMVTRAGEPKVIDMGLVAEMPLPAGGPLPPRRVGKVGYMAPEVYRAAAPYNGRTSDVWCLGVMLTIMVLGVPPYRVPDAAACRLFNEIEQGRFVGLVRHWRMDAFVSAPCLDLLNRMLVVAPDARPSLQAVLDHPWMRALHAEHLVRDPLADAALAELEARTGAAQARRALAAGAVVPVAADAAGAGAGEAGAGAAEDGDRVLR
jgi:5'-AMP-activated protein kinase catalytic alpha subunit